MRRFLGRPGLYVLWLAAVAATAQDSSPPVTSRPMEFESDSFSLDRPSNIMTFNGFAIETDEWNVRADIARAHGDELDFEDGQWQFSGHVEINIESARISGSQATFVFKDQQLVSGELAGEPVLFEATAPRREGPVTGRASVIRYDNELGAVELLGEVQLTVGQYQASGCDLVYYLREEDFTTGSAQCDQPFKVTFSPQDSEQPVQDAPPAP